MRKNWKGRFWEMDMDARGARITPKVGMSSPTPSPSPSPVWVAYLHDHYDDYKVRYGEVDKFTIVAVAEKPHDAFRVGLATWFKSNAFGYLRDFTREDPSFLDDLTRVISGVRECPEESFEAKFKEFENFFVEKWDKNSDSGLGDGQRLHVVRFLPSQEEDATDEALAKLAELKPVKRE
jgi:hypothetical protein